MLVRLALLSLVLAALAPGLRADEVTMKDGRRYRGVILRETPGSVRILTAEGRTVTLRRRDVASVAADLSVGAAPIDARLEGLDGTDPAAFLRAASAARDSQLEGWEFIAYLGLARHPEDAGLQEILGRVAIAGRWFCAEAASWVPEGGILPESRATHPDFVRWRGGWIRKEERVAARRETELYTRDDRGFWRLRSAVLREKGFVQVNGKWIKGVQPEDLEAMRGFEELTGKQIWVTSGLHFRIATQQGAEEARKTLDFAETAYGWLRDELGLAADEDPFGGRKLDVWLLEDPAAFASWLEHFASRYDLSEEQVLFFRRISKATSWMMAARELKSDVAPVPHWLANYIGNEVVSALYATEKVAPAWLGQAFGYLVQARRCGDIQVSFVDRGRRKDGSPGTFGVRTLAAARELAREQTASIDVPLEKLEALGINDLEQAHVVKGLTLVAWLLETRRADLLRWIRRGGQIGMVAAVPEVFACDAATLDQRWREAVRAPR